MNDGIILAVPGSTTAMARVVADIVRERVAQEAKDRAGDEGSGPS